MKRVIFLMLATAVLVLSSCKDDPIVPKPPGPGPNPPGGRITAPATYNFTKNNSSSVDIADQIILSSMADQLVHALKNKPAGITMQKLTAMFDHKANGNDFTGDDADKLNRSSMNLKAKTGDNNIEANIKDAYDNVFPKWDNNAEKGKPGRLKRKGKQGYKHFNAKGLELHEAVEKDFIGGLTANMIAMNLSKAKLDAADNTAVVSGKNYTAMEHLWDEAYGILYGAKGDGGKNPLADGAEGESSFLNEYVEKVSELKAFKGIGKTIFDAFKLGRAAIVAKNYSVRDAQAKKIIDNIAKVMAVRCVYYLENSKPALRHTDFGAAFHTLSEGVGFIRALKFVQENATKTFPARELDGLYASLTSGDGFWAMSEAKSGERTKKIQPVLNRIAQVYGFTVAQATTK